MIMHGRSLKTRLSTSNLIIAGFVFILAGNLFSLQVLNVKIHEVCANVGALLLVTGALQWLFDAESRQTFFDEIKFAVAEQLQDHDKLHQLGITAALLDSHLITEKDEIAHFEHSQRLVIGLHYSTRTISRFESIIRKRISSGLETQILYIEPVGSAATYLAGSINKPLNVPAKTQDLITYVHQLFSSTPLVKLTPLNRVLRYAFVATEIEIWVIFNTSSAHYESVLPAFKVSAPSAFYQFFHRDIVDLGVNL